MPVMMAVGFAIRGECTTSGQARSSENKTDQTLREGPAVVQQSFEGDAARDRSDMEE
jgi:hypothetical protein